MKTSAKKPAGLKLFVALVVLMVAAVVVTGLYVAGSPAKVRDRQLDDQRVNAVEQLANAVDNFYDRNGKLPASIDEMRAEGPDAYYVPTTTDPKTGASYEYIVDSDTKYELCATFDDSTQQEDMYGNPTPSPVPPPVMTPQGVKTRAAGVRDWTHGPGRQCYTLDVEDRQVTVACGLRNPCQSGQTCAELPGRKGTYCVPVGKECAAAGCSEDQCTVSGTYPAQVTCAAEPPPLPPKNTCALMQNKKSGQVQCYGCVGDLCKNAPAGWVPYEPPKNGASIPYGCFATAEGCMTAE